MDNRVENLYARKLLEDTFDTKAKIEAMTANKSKEFHKAAYKEAIWKVSLMFFGDDPYGRNNSLGLKRVMSKLTPDPGLASRNTSQECWNLIPIFRTAYGRRG